MSVEQVCCIITEPAGDTLLLRFSGSHCELPRVDVRASERVDMWDMSDLHQIVRQYLNADVLPVYAMDVIGSDSPLAFAAFEARGAESVAGPGWRWVPLKNAGKHLRSALESSLVAQHLAGRKPAADTGIVPWLRRGWLREAEAWVRDQLSARGIALESHLEPVTSRFVGRVLRVETSIGPVYFKAVSRVFCREVAIALDLSAWQPQHIPAPLAADPGRGWMLTAEVDGPTLAQIDAVEVWEKALRVYAQLQKASVEALAQGSLPSLYDWRPDTVAGGLDTLMAELEWLQTGYDDPLSREELAALRREAPLFNDMSLELARCGLPTTLEHDDLHPGNVRVVDGTPVYLDWAWSCVTHPFLSLCMIVAEGLLPAGLLLARSRLLKAYFDEWKEHGSEQELAALFRLADTWKVIEYAAADAEWVRCYLKALQGHQFPENSYLAWTVRQRQYYLVKCLRRMLKLPGSASRDA